MNLLKGIFSILMMVVLCIPSGVSASAEKILFIPHDDRPISYHQTVDVVRNAGYNMIIPPKELLSNATNMGHPDELWQWLFDNANGASSAVIASDSMLYGGLIPSRKHEVSNEQLTERLANFERLRSNHKDLHIYIFDSLMRTPKQGTEGDIEEPEYYAKYGADIFKYTSLVDKKEMDGLSKKEESELENLKNAIPDWVMKDYMERRAKNLSATMKLMDLTRDGVIDYLILGRDDNAPLCQTHLENRSILAYAADNSLPKSKFQSMPGIDEFNILLLARSINDMTKDVPKVFVEYNNGVGGDTVPDFSDEKISASVDAALAIAGGEKVSSPKGADFVLLINTDEKGRTFEIHNDFPDGGDFKPELVADRSVKHFAGLAEKYVKKGYPVGIADIKFANGSDNALMELLRKKGMLFRLQAYSGWNTPTNSTGFAIGTGLLAKNMSEDAKNRLLAVRYLDDWAYQANVRTIVGNELVKNFGDPLFYIQLKDKLGFAEERNTVLMREFAKKNMPHFDYLKDFEVRNPWLRMFECDILIKN